MRSLLVITSCQWSALALLLLACAGCERAEKSPKLISTEPSRVAATALERKPPAVLPHYGWLPTPARLDIPLQFIAEEINPEEWKALKEYWTEEPVAAGILITPLGMPALEAATTLAWELQVASVKIKVPRGLPDPTPSIPAANPPTLGKWTLGRRLFFDTQLLRISSTLTRSCADCHDPAQAYALNVVKPASGKRNVPSLLNCVFNQRQFWDGRADALEQVMLRQLEDEAEPPKDRPLAQSPGYLHVWPGVVKRVGGNQAYLDAFDLVFGRDPTADSIAKALATYMRSLLSGNSLIDRAMHHRRQRGGATIGPENVEPFLTDYVLKEFPTKLTKQETAKAIARGHELFQGRARCSKCHTGPLFTDNDFHNLGIGESAAVWKEGEESGRFAFVPFGLKERRLIGAFKTPSLRDASRTAPYMHDGSLATLADVLTFFNEGKPFVALSNFDPEFTTEAERGGMPHLGAEDLAALEFYMRALRGEELPAFVQAPPKQ